MPLSASSLAATVGVGSKGVQFAPSANTLPRRNLIIGTYDETTKTTIVPETQYLVTSAEDVGDKFGFGFMVHALAKEVFLGSGGVETWVIPQAEDVAGVAATGTITVTVTTAVAGTLYLYIAGTQYQIPVVATDDSNGLAAKIDAAVNADSEALVTSGVATNVVTLTSKAEGPWGNDISITLNQQDNEQTPGGVSLVIVDMASGAGIPDIQDALDATGTGDDQNERYFTELIHGYGQDSTTLGKISVWNGEGNDFLGNYAKTVARPLRSLVGDVAAGSSGLSNLVTLADGRLQDRTNGVIAVPGSANHPSLIAAQALGIMSRINSDVAAEHYVGKVLSGVLPGAPADRWTSNYDSRDTAVKGGISPTVISGGSVLMQDVMTFYRPASVPVDSNSYALQRNVSIIENITDSVRVNFAAEKWQGVFIVSDVAKVTSTIDRQKARDLNAVQNDVIALARQWESKGWIYTADFTINEIKKGTYISIRAGATGFDIIIPVLLSGAGRIYNAEVRHDASLAILTA